MEYLDIDALAPLQRNLASLSGLYLALYGERGNLILPPSNENALLMSLRGAPTARDEYREFLQASMKRALQRSDVSIFKGPGELSHFFMPIRIDTATFLVVGGGVFASSEDRETFLKMPATEYGMSADRQKALAQEVAIRGSSELQSIARALCSIFSLGLRSSYRGAILEKRYRLVKAVFGLLSDVQPEKEPDKLYDIILDMILFLFNVESIAIMVREGSVLKARRTGGRMRDYLSTVTCRISGILSDVIEKQRPLSSDSAMDILRLGFSDKIISFHAFPILSENRVTGALLICNSSVSEEDADIIFDICRMMGGSLRIAELEGTYYRCLKEKEVLNTAATRLIPVKEPDVLYETILDMSVRLTEAEKGSLMLMNEELSCLTVRAAKGINRRLLTDIKVKAGEGVAGWVFKEGVPLVMDDIEKNEWGFPKRHKYRTGSFVSVPLKLGEKIIGVLNLSDKISGEVFSEDDMALISSFASYAVIALERSTYYSLAGHLKALSVTDSLTGLFNRRYFEERFFEELNRSDRHNLAFSLAMIDIDDFKLFNDSEGHLAGDEILKSIAAIAKDCLRVSDVLARFGGEEFAVIMPQTEREEAVLVAERIRRSIKEQIPSTWSFFPRKSITVSIGIATFPYDGKDRKELIRNADKALYMAKMEGKDRTVPWHAKG